VLRTIPVGVEGFASKSTLTSLFPKKRRGFDLAAPASQCGPLRFAADFAVSISRLWREAHESFQLYSSLLQRSENPGLQELNFHFARQQTGFDLDQRVGSLVRSNSIHRTDIRANRTG
jgi:hypothetical protein